VNVIKFETDEGEEIELPAKYEVCSRCEGEGAHTNPNIDGNGITASEWEEDWDEESRENYMNGVYDVTCVECDGRRVVAVLDREAADPELVKQYDAYQESLARSRAEERYERRLCGDY
jgi:RecB family endonuclease NucS